MTTPVATNQAATGKKMAAAAGVAVAVEAVAAGAPDPFLPLRWARLTRLLRLERRTADRFSAIASDWAQRLAGRVVHAGSGTVDQFAVRALAPEFSAAVDNLVEVEVRQALDEGLEDAWPDAEPLDDHYVNRYLGRVRNRLTGVPDEVFHLVRGQVARAASEGWDPAALAAKIETVLRDADQATWAGRGLVIARTETLAAYNAGQLQGFRGYAASMGGPWEKGWLSTHDQRTRATHRAADLAVPGTGQRVPLDRPFTVGGFSLDHPGDPFGPPQEVIQCRCSMLLLRPGETPDLSTRHGKGSK